MFIKLFKIYSKPELLLLLIIFIKCEIENNIDLPYPISFNLLNNNIIIFSSKGFFTFDSYFSLLSNYTFPSELNLDLSLNENYPTFSQFSTNEGEYVLSLFNKNIYLFNSDGKILNIFYIGNDLMNDIYSFANTYNIIPFKVEGTYLYYFVIYIHFIYDGWKGGTIYVLYYKININDKNELIRNITYKEKDITISESAITCQRIFQIDNNYIICFFEEMSNKICKISFDPESFNFENKECMNFINGEYFKFAYSTVNNDQSKIYICYTNGVSSGICFYYNIKQKYFSQLNKFGINCNRNYYHINLKFFKITQEYVFSCVGSSSEYYIVKFKENFNFISPNNTGLYITKDCNGINSFSILYSIEYNNYMLLTDNICSIRKTRIYEISNFFTNSTNNSNLYESTEILTSNNKIESSEEIDKSIIIINTNEITKETYWTNEITILNENSNYIINTQTSNINEKSFETNKNIEMTNIYEDSEKIIKTNEIINKSENSYDDIINKCNDEKKIMNKNGDCVCNNEKGYYILKINELLFGKECYNLETKPQNFYLNKENKYFDECFENCKTCDYNGNDDENNCTSCIENYVFLPSTKNNTNCVPKCDFYYYYTYYGLYSCTNNFQCPDSVHLLIRKKNKCIDNCSKDNIYKYQYNGECFEECPENTKINNYKCEIKNTNICSLGLFELNLTYADIDGSNIDSIIKNYVEEFNYTNNQIVNYTNKEYTLVIYKNSSCIKELLLKIPQIDFGNCYKKVKEAYNIKEDLIIAILDKYIQNQNSITTYSLFNPVNGEKLNTSKICKDDVITMKENILSLPGVNPSLIKFFADQGINVFNISDRFYIDICFSYKSPNNKDIPLNYRLKLFFPNISLCDDGCVIKGVDLKTMESICNCPFNEFSKIFSGTLKYADYLGDIYSFISESSFEVVFCFKNIFIYEYFKKNIGGFIIMTIIFFQTICVLVYFLKSKIEIKKYLFILLKSYIHSFRDSGRKKEIKSKDKLKKRIFSPNKKNNIISNKFIKKSKINSYRRNSSINESPSLLNRFKSIYNTSKKKRKATELSRTEKTIINSKFKKISENNSHDYIIQNRASDKTLFNFKEYLSKDYEDMDFDDVIEKDKRKFCKFFWEVIKKKYIIINTFFVTDNINPKSMKIILLLLTIDFCCLFNAFMFNESYIKNLYNREDDSFFRSILDSMANLIYVFIITKVIKELILCFFFKEKKIKGIFKRGRNNPNKIKMDIIEFIKRMEKFNNSFIITTYIITLLSWFYISCFNSVYYYSRIEWLKSSVVSFILSQAISIGIYLLETILRYLALCLKNEKLFKWSKIIE